MLRETDFLDYFSKLKGRSAEEQMAFIGRARHEVFVRQRRTGRAAILLVLSFLLAAMVASVPLIFGGESLLVNSMFIAVGVVISMQMYKRLYGRLLKQGLKLVLERPS